MYWHGLALRFPITVIIRTKVSKVEIGHLSTFIYCIEWTSCSINRRRPSTLRMKESGLKDRPPPPTRPRPIQRIHIRVAPEICRFLFIALLLEGLGCSETRGIGCLDLDFLPSFGVAPLASGPVRELEGAKAQELHFLPPGGNLL